MNCSQTTIKSSIKNLISSQKRRLLRAAFLISADPNMSMIRSLVSFYRRKVQFLDHHGSHSHGIVRSHNQGLATMGHGRLTPCTGPKTTVEMSSDIAVTQPFPHRPPPRSPFSTWARWVLGSMLTLALPFWEKKWTTLLRIEGEVEEVADAVEEVADVVEKVATVVEKVSSEVAERFPEDGKLKDAVLLVEHVSREAAEDAHVAKHIIQQMDEVLKQEVESLLESSIGDAGKAVDGKDGHRK